MTKHKVSKLTIHPGRRIRATLEQAKRLGVPPGTELECRQITSTDGYAPVAGVVLHNGKRVGGRLEVGG